MKRTTIKVPSQFEHWKNEVLEELIKEILHNESISIPEAKDRKIFLDEDTNKKLELLSELKGIPKSNLIYFLLLLSSVGSKPDRTEEKSPEGKEKTYKELYRSTGVTVTVTGDVNFYLLNLERIRTELLKIDIVKKSVEGTIVWDDVFRSHQKEVVDKILNSGVVFLDSESLNSLYNKSFDSYVDFALAFLFVFNREKDKPNPVDLGEQSILSFELYLPESVFLPGVPVKNFLKLKEEDGKSHFHAGTLDNQLLIQDIAGKLMDTHYISEDTTQIKVHQWMYEAPWSFKINALNYKFPVNPFWVGRAHKIAPVEIFLTADELYGIDYQTGEKLREFFKKFVGGRKERVWFGQFMDKNIMVFRSGYFVIGKFPMAEDATEKLAEIVLNWMKSGSPYSYFNLDYMSGSAIGAWYGNIIIPNYHITSSIAYFAGINPAVDTQWRKYLNKSMAKK